MIFISDLVEHEVETNHIEMVEDTIFSTLEVPEMTKHEGTTGIEGVTFYAGYILQVRVTKVKLTSGSIIVR